MTHKVIWSGLADKKYWEYIAKYCVPSWTTLPGHKQIINDGSKIKLKGIEIIDWKDVPNKNAKFVSGSKKQDGFWRKMQSQVWALKTFKNYDWVVLLDTDVEILNFNQELFLEILQNTQEGNFMWATGESQKRKLDAGHIIVNMKHPSLPEFIKEYEDIWESGKIFDLRKAYDGDAVQSLLEKYPSYKIKNRDYGQGLHLYELGTVHWGSKEPKALRAAWTDSGQSLVEKRLLEIEIKNYKGEN